MGTKGFLCVKANASGDEERIELLDALEVVLTEGMDSIVVEVKRFLFLTRLNNPALPFFAWNVKDITAHLVNQMVWIGRADMFLEHSGEALDKADDIVGLLFRWTETSIAVLGDNELVAVNTASITANTDKRRITHSVTSVQGVTGVKKDFLNVDAVKIVLIGKVIHTHDILLLVVILSSEISGNLAPFTGMPRLYPIRIGVGLQPLLCSLDNLMKLCCLLITLQRRATSFGSNPCSCSIAVRIDRKIHSLLLQQCQTMNNSKELADIIGAIDWTETENLLSRRDMHPSIFHPARIAATSSIHTEGFYSSSVNHSQQLTLYYLPMPCP